MRNSECMWKTDVPSFSQDIGGQAGTTHSSAFSLKHHRARALLELYLLPPHLPANHCSVFLVFAKTHFMITLRRSTWPCWYIAVSFCFLASTEKSLYDLSFRLCVSSWLCKLQSVWSYEYAFLNTLVHHTVFLAPRKGNSSFLYTHPWKHQ